MQHCDDLLLYENLLSRRCCPLGFCWFLPDSCYMLSTHFPILVSPLLFYLLPHNFFIVSFYTFRIRKQYAGCIVFPINFTFSPFAVSSAGKFFAAIPSFIITNPILYQKLQVFRLNCAKNNGNLLAPSCKHRRIML